MLSKRASHSDLKQIMEHFDKVINDYKFKLLDKYSNESDMKIWNKQTCYKLLQACHQQVHTIKFFGELFNPNILTFVKKC